VLKNPDQKIIGHTCVERASLFVRHHVCIVSSHTCKNREIEFPYRFFGSSLLEGRRVGLW